jgi:hypothetical protein
MGEPAVPSVYPPPVPSTANTKIEERRIETSGDLPVSVPIPPRHRLIIIVHVKDLTQPILATRSTTPAKRSVSFFPCGIPPPVHPELNPARESTHVTPLSTNPISTTSSVSTTSSFPCCCCSNGGVVDELQPAVRDAQVDAPVQQARDHQVACVAHDGLGAAKEVGPVHRAESAVQAAQVAKAEVGKDGFVTFGMADWAGLRTAGMASRAVAFGAAGGHLLEDCLMEGLDGSMGVV